ncbi:MAG TPA: hypothetical protein DCY20_11700 [Firmicutes bacterium]|nr:hypothetical protein [Bacillota bacterium]
MLEIIKKADRKEVFFMTIIIILIGILSIIPTGFEKQIYMNSEGVKAKVISTENSGMWTTGLVTQGDQECQIEILSGQFKGEQISGINMLQGKLEFDKIFEEGDTVWVLIEKNMDEEIIFANIIDYYRVDKEILLVAVFVICIILFSGFTGVRTIMSFALALLCIWKILIPSMLNGIHPMLIALLVGNAITIITLLLVAGFTKKAYCAIGAAVICSFMTCLLAHLFGNLFEIHGAVMDWSESLLYAGYANLNLTALFQAGIYLASSGAILDLAIDISAALDEVSKANPLLSRAELMKSGLTIGKSIVGSQTTTLLLAYMGSYITIMMVYMAQGTPFMSILNSQKISSEILHTFVGCIGLVLVSPLTSFICSLAYKKEVPSSELV